MRRLLEKIEQALGKSFVGDGPSYIKRDWTLAYDISHFPSSATYQLIVQTWLWMVVVEEDFKDQILERNGSRGGSLPCTGGYLAWGFELLKCVVDQKLSEASIFSTSRKIILVM